MLGRKLGEKCLGETDNIQKIDRKGQPARKSKFAFDSSISSEKKVFSERKSIYLP